MEPIRLIRHEAVPQCGSFEVRFSDGKPSRYFYWDDVPGRRMRPDQMTGEVALELAKAFARAECNGTDVRPDWQSERSGFKG